MLPVSVYRTVVNAFKGTINLKDRQCTCNLTLWRVRVTTFAMEAQQWVMCIVEVHVTLNNIKIRSVTQKCFYGKFISPATIKCA
jgi:hypothetical protein